MLSVPLRPLPGGPDGAGFGPDDLVSHHRVGKGQRPVQGGDMMGLPLEGEDGVVALVRLVDLGPRILRAETAVVAALSMRHAIWGDGA